MLNWNYNASDYEAKSFSIIPIGDHRCKIASVEEQTSSSGNPMLKIVLDISGHNSTIWYFLVFDKNNPEITNNKLGAIFDSFGITPGDMNTLNWVNKFGACRVKHEMYNGSQKAAVQYFVSRDKQANLPAWVNPSNSTPAPAPAPTAPAFNVMPEPDLPFGV